MLFKNTVRAGSATCDNGLDRVYLFLWGIECVVVGAVVAWRAWM